MIPLLKLFIKLAHIAPSAPCRDFADRLIRVDKQKSGHAQPAIIHDRLERSSSLLSDQPAERIRVESKFISRFFERALRTIVLYITQDRR